MITNQNTIEVHTLETKVNSIDLENVNGVYFVFYNISYESDKLGSQLRNYVAFILHTW